jgi:hypothetical protein
MKKERKQRVHYSEDMRAKILAQYEAASRGKKEAVLSRYRISRSAVLRWREEMRARDTMTPPVSDSAGRIDRQEARSLLWMITADARRRGTLTIEQALAVVGLISPREDDE